MQTTFNSIEGKRVRTLEADPQYFGGYLNMARHNLYGKNKVTEWAKASDRLRMNYNLHDILEAKSRRLLNALEPGTVLSFHRQLNTRRKNNASNQQE